MAISIKAGSLGELLEEVIKEVETDGSEDKKESFIKSIIEDAKKSMEQKIEGYKARTDFYEATFKDLEYPIACATLDFFATQWAEEHNEDALEMISTILSVMIQRRKRD